MDIGSFNGLPSTVQGGNFLNRLTPLQNGKNNTPQETLSNTADKTLPANNGATLIAGALSLDLSFSAKSISLTERSNGNALVKQRVEKSFDASYHFDFAFLSKSNIDTNRLAELSPSLLKEFADTASSLVSLNEKDLSKFTQTVDKLFNKIKDVLGGNSSGMIDSAKELFKSTLSDFFQAVQGEVQSLKNTAPKLDAPPPPPPPPIEGLPVKSTASNGEKPKQGIDFNSLFNKTMERFDKNLFDMLKEFLDKSPKAIRDGQMRLSEGVNGDVNGDVSDSVKGESA